MTWSGGLGDDVALPKVSVIILNYNGLEFLPACLETLQRTEYSSLEVIVVDNHSLDGSVEYLRQQHPRIRLIALAENLGYSGAYNATLSQVSGEFFVLLNFDVEVAPDWLNQSMAVLTAEPDVAAVQPKLRALQNRTMLEYSGGCGGYIDRFGYPFVRGRVFDTVEEDLGQYDEVVPIHWASGAALVVRRKAYDEVGGLDNDFFLHMEELDLCWRFWLAGWKVKAAPAGIVYHHAGAALSAEHFHKMYYNHRNGLVMMLKNIGSANLIVSMFGRWVLDWLTILTSPLRGEPKRSLAVLAAHWQVVTGLSSILRKRKSVQRLRKVPDNSLQHVIFPRSVVWRYYFKKMKTYSQISAEW